jgi:bacterioferritin
MSANAVSKTLSTLTEVARKFGNAHIFNKIWRSIRAADGFLVDCVPTPSFRALRYHCYFYTPPFSAVVRRANSICPVLINGADTMSALPVVIDLHVIRVPVPQHFDSAVLDDAMSAHADHVIKLLNEALATELVCVLRYRRHHFMALAINSQNAAREFMAHANAELHHADLLAERIVQLGGAPDFTPAALTQRDPDECPDASSLPGMIRQALVAGGLAIDNYRGMVQFLGEGDPTTRRMLEGILAVEENHADEMAELLISRFKASARMLETHRKPLPVIGIALQFA